MVAPAASDEVPEDREGGLPEVIENGRLEGDRDLARVEGLLGHYGARTWSL